MRWLDALAKKAPAGRTTRPSPTGWREAYEASSRGDYARALEIWGPLAHAGVARAQNNVGACFAEGLGVERDPGLAPRWLTLAAASGRSRRPAQSARRSISRAKASSRTMHGALELYRARRRTGRRRRPGHAELDAARRRSRRAGLRRGAALGAELAAAQGVAASMTRLGMIYHNALGVERDPAEAPSIGGGAAPSAATPTARPCWARPSISAPACSAIRSRPWSGCCARAPAAARWRDRSFEPCAPRSRREQIAEAERRAAVPLPEPAP